MSGIVKGLRRLWGAWWSAVANGVAGAARLLGFRFLVSRACPARVGELALQMDLFVKTGVLGWRPRFRGIFIARRDRVANPCLWNHWSRYARMISSDFALESFLFRVSNRFKYNTESLPWKGGDGLHKDRALVAAQAEWERQGRGPLLALTEEHRDRGRREIERIGIPTGAWFVCLHAREPGFLGEKDDPYHAYRNADIETYLPGAKIIVDAGGWVIRMGDPTTKPLPRMERVLDYAHSALRSDWMDVFWCAEARFFLGTSSGLFNVAFVFGTPCALANFAPFSDRPWSGKDLFIPKLYRSAAENRFLNFEQALAPPLRHCYDGNQLATLGIRVVDHTPEEINELVLEMLGRLDGTIKYSTEDRELQGRFNALLTFETRGVASRVGRDFLRRYSRLLPAQATLPRVRV